MIREWRILRGLTQTDLGMLVGCPLRTINSYETGMAGPPYDTLIRIAHACDMPLSAFVAPLDSLVMPDRTPRPPNNPTGKNGR